MKGGTLWRSECSTASNRFEQRDSRFESSAQNIRAAGIAVHTSLTTYENQFRSSYYVKQ